MELSRINSQDTLFTNSGEVAGRNPNEDNSTDDSRSLLTFNSTETLTNELFHHSVNDFKLISLPLISFALSSDVQVHKNLSLIDTGPPILSTSTSFLHYFKLKAPFLLINQYGEDVNSKSDFCKSYHKVLSKNLSCYILIFNNSDYVILYNNELKPYVDFEWRNVKFRILGTTGTTSTFGNGLIKMYLVNKSYNTLSDNMQVTISGSQINSSKDISIKFPSANENVLLDKLLANDKSYIAQNLTNTSVLSTTPFAVFEDDNKKLKKFFTNGQIKMFDPHPNVADPDNRDLSSDGLVLLSVLLTLREQETRKNKGNNRPTYK